MGHHDAGPHESLLNIQLPAVQPHNLRKHACSPRLHALFTLPDGDRKRSRQRRADSIVDGERRDMRVGINTRVVDVSIDGDQKTTVLRGIGDVIYLDSSIIRHVEADLRPGTGFRSEGNGTRTRNTRDQQGNHTRRCRKLGYVADQRRFLDVGKRTRTEGGTSVYFDRCLH